MFCTLVLLCTYKYGKDLTLQIKELIKRARYNFESLWRECILFINIHWPNKAIDNWYRNLTNGSLFNRLSHIKFKNSFKSVNLTLCLAKKKNHLIGEIQSPLSHRRSLNYVLFAFMHCRPWCLNRGRLVSAAARSISWHLFVESQEFIWCRKSVIAFFSG